MATGDMDHSMLRYGVPCCGNGDGHEHGCLMPLPFPSRPHQNEDDTNGEKILIEPEASILLGETSRSAGIYFCSRFFSVNHVLHFSGS